MTYSLLEGFICVKMGWGGLYGINWQFNVNSCDLSQHVWTTEHLFKMTSDFALIIHGKDQIHGSSVSLRLKQRYVICRHH